MSSSISLSSIPTISDLYKTGDLSPPPSPSTLPASPEFNSKISLIRADITKLATTCIVNAANTSLLGGGGVDGAIHAAAGPGLYDECLPLNGCATGSAKMTSAHELPSKHVIHAVGPIYAKAKREGGETRPSELLEGCYRTSLDLAASLGQPRAGAEKEDGTDDKISIAFSCLSTGVYGYPSNEAARVACRVVRDWLQRSESRDQVARVVFCCFLDKDVRAYREWLPKTFPATPSNLSQRSHGLGEEEEAQRQEAEEGEGSTTTSTGATQTLLTTHLSPSSPPPKKQRTSSPIPNLTADDDKEWEAVEKPQHSLASSTIDSTSEVDPAASTDSVPLGESTVHVDAAEARSEGETAAGGKGGLEGELDDEGEGVKVEKPRGLEEDDGVEVEKPGVENRLGKDW